MAGDSPFLQFLEEPGLLPPPLIPPGGEYVDDFENDIQTLELLVGLVRSVIFKRVDELNFALRVARIRLPKRASVRIKNTGETEDDTQPLAKRKNQLTKLQTDFDSILNGDVYKFIQQLADGKKRKLWGGNRVGLLGTGTGFRRRFQVSAACRMLHSPCHSVSIVPCGVHVLTVSDAQSCRMHSVLVSDAQCHFTDAQVLTE